MSLRAALDRIGSPRLLVLGDLILDRYTFGNAERVSQEAPVILLRAEQRENRLGGAANVGNMLVGLEARAVCLGVVGDDAAGGEMRGLLASCQVDAEGLIVDPSRPTTVKERFIGRAAGRHGHQILRVDSEVRDPVSPAIEDELLRQAERLLEGCDAALISDYDKGVCTPRLLEKLIAACRRAGLPVLADPLRGGDYQRYRGVTTMTPNRLESGLAAEMTVDSLDSARQAAMRLVELYGVESAIVTLDRDGMLLARRETNPSENGRADEQPGPVTTAHFPTRTRQVYDITGAGDMVLAMIGAVLASGGTLEEACALANVAGGLEVEKVGVARVTRDEIRADLAATSGGLSGGSLADPSGGAASGSSAGQPAERRRAAGRVTTLDGLLPELEKQRAAGRKIVFTNGCFDLLHVGHVTYLAEAAGRGDLLVVGLNSDASVRQLKGPTRPVIAERDRASMLAALSSVDYVVVFHQPTPIDLIRAIRPDVLVKGGDYLGREREIPGREFVESYGGKLYLAGHVEGVSTSRILKSTAA